MSLCHYLQDIQEFQEDFYLIGTIRDILAHRENFKHTRSIVCINLGPSVIWDILESYHNDKEDIRRQLYHDFPRGHVYLNGVRINLHQFQKFLERYSCKQLDTILMALATQSIFYESFYYANIIHTNRSSGEYILSSGSWPSAPGQGSSVSDQRSSVSIFSGKNDIGAYYFFLEESQEIIFMAYKQFVCSNIFRDTIVYRVNTILIVRIICQDHDYYKIGRAHV